MRRNQSWTGFHRIRGHGPASGTDPLSIIPDHRRNWRVTSLKMRGVVLLFRNWMEWELTVWSWQILQKLDPCQCLNVIMRPHRVKHRARKGCERRIAEERIPCYEALLAGRFQVNHLRQSNQPFRIYITIEIVIRIRIIRTFIFLYYSIGEN